MRIVPAARQRVYDISSVVFAAGPHQAAAPLRTDERRRVRARRRQEHAPGAPGAPAAAHESAEAALAAVFDQEAPTQQQHQQWQQSPQQAPQQQHALQHTPQQQSQHQQQTPQQTPQQQPWGQRLANVNFTIGWYECSSSRRRNRRVS
jgi:hypothetical protein